MKTRAELLALRRQRLIDESAYLRDDLALQMQPLAHTLESVNVGLRILDRVRRHPGWLASAALGLMLVTPRRLSALLQMGTSSLRTWRSFAPYVQGLLRR